MGDYRAEGIATALSSISHGGEHSGTTSYLRRERIITPDGVPVQVPVISGNGWRGMLRDISADLTWRMLGQPPLALPVFHLLWSGGQLTKTGAAQSIGSRQLARLRELVPHLSVFGGSGGGRIVEGKLSVGKMVPISAETAHLCPLADGDSHPPIGELLQIEEFSRRDDGKRPLPALAAGDDQPTGQGELLAVADPTSDERDGPAHQMRYGVETIAAGARLWWWLALRGVSELEAALVAQVLETWASSGAHIGGRSATGHGRLALDVSRWHAPVADQPVAELTSAAAPTLLEAHHRDHAAEILDALDGMSA